MIFVKKALPILVLILVIFSCKQEKKSINNMNQEIVFKKEGTLKIIKDSVSTIALDIEIADNEYKRQTGLMYRTKLNEKQAMLFIFEDEKPRSFYMKNTYIPLDIIFINADRKIVSVAENAEATNEASLPSNGPTKYVLEINAGLFKKWGLEVGNQIAYLRPIKMK